MPVTVTSRRPEPLGADATSRYMPSGTGRSPASALTMNVHRVMPLVVGPSVGGVHCGSWPVLGVAPRGRRGGARGCCASAGRPASGAPAPDGCGWSEAPIVKVRNGPNWASMGLAQEALVGVRHSSTLCPAAQAADGGGLVRRQVVHDHVDGCAVGSGRPDRLERSQRVVPALAPPGDTPQLIVAEAVTAVEVADAVRAVIRRGQPGRLRLRRPGRAVTRPDRQRPELVERETAHREVAAHVRRCGRAWRPCPGRWIPSRSGCAGS